MSGERCPSCPPDVPGNWPCAAPGCPRTVDGKDLIVPIQTPPDFMGNWKAQDSKLRVNRYKRVCAGGSWYWREKP